MRSNLGNLRSAALTVLLAVLIATPAGAQTAAAAKIRQVPPLALDLPPAGRATGEIIQRLLTSAEVPFGLEQAPEPADARPPDLGRDRQGFVTLNGLAIGAALDRITTLDPRYEWEEAGGRIIVRAAALHGAGVLGRPIPGLTLTRATIGDALLTLMRAIDPNRPEGGLATFGLRMTSDPAGAMQSKASTAEKRIGLSLGHTTVFEALNAVAQAASVSWTVRYELPNADPESVSITLSGNGGSVAALSSRMLRAGKDPASRSRLRVFAVPSVMSAYGQYAQRAKVLIGVELPPEPIDRATPSGGPALDLTDVPAADAIDRITRLDSRLTWSVADGIFSVRPRPDLVPTSPLDTVVESFVAQDETVDAILGRVALLFGGRVSGSGRGGGGRPGSPEEQQVRKSLARPLSFRLERTTIREILDTLSRTQGSLSWHVQPMEQPTTGILLSLQVGSWDSWSVSRSIQLARW